MSFLTDLVEGHTDKLGTDLSHAGSSFANHPMEWAEVGGAAALGAAPFLLPELGGLLGGGAGAEAGGGLFGGLGGLFGGGSSAAVDAGGGLLTNAAGESLGAIGDPLAEATANITDIGSANSINAANSGFPSFANADPSAFSAVNQSVMPGSSAGFGGAPGVPAGASVPGAMGEAGGNVIGASGTAVDAGGNAMASSTAGGSDPGFFSNITNSLMHPTLPGVAQGAGALATGGGLAMNMMRGNQSGGPNAQALSQQAALESQQGQQLMSYLKNGTLPPALKAKMDQAMAAEKARIMSRYPAGTTPATNSSMAQDLNNMQTNAVAAMAQAQIELLNTGLKETGMSTQIYDILTKLDESHNQDLMKSIATFAGALGGSGFGVMQKVAA